MMISKANTYNAEKIKLKPGFLTTTLDASIVIILAISLIIAGILMIYKQGQAWPFFLIALPSSIPLLAKIKTDKDLFNKISRME